MRLCVPKLWIRDFTAVDGRGKETFVSSMDGWTATKRYNITKKTYLILGIVFYMVNILYITIIIKKN